MRYRFTGLRRESGQPVMGHVEAETDDKAYDILGDNDIIAEGLVADPEQTDDSRQPGLASAIDSALAASSHPVPFDSLRGQYAGKHVWVIDREKIKRQVVRTVDDVIQQSRQGAEDDTQTKNRLSKALEKLFGDNRNLTSPASADPPAKPSAPTPVNHEAMDIQLNRLADVVRELEHAVGAIRSATRWSGGGNAGRRAAPQRRVDAANDEVLREIFQANVELLRRLKAGPETDNGEQERSQQARS